MTERGSPLLDTSGGEKLTVEERLKLAKKKRAQQVKKYQQNEKQMDKEIEKKRKKNLAAKVVVGRAKVNFAESVMLLEAAARNDIEEVRQMLVAGVDPNMSNDDGLTPLHQSCIDNSEEMMKLLISFGADVNARDSEMWSPLHAAATCGHAHLCKLLIQNGADLLSVNGDGNMPYDICEHEAALDHIESEMAKRGITQEVIDKARLVPEQTMLADLKVLIEDGGSLEFRGRSGETPLHVAATNGYVEATQFLLDHKVSVSVTDQDLWQPIHCATYWCQVPIVELLIRNGASLDARTRTGETAIDICGDAATKKRILALKREIEGTTRDFKSRLQAKQRNASVRGRRGSVKRSSMKEKKALSLKEPREEGRFLQNATIENDDEDKDNATAEEGELKQSQSKQSETSHVPDDSKESPTTRNAVQVENGTTSKPVPPHSSSSSSEIQLDDCSQKKSSPRLSGDPSASNESSSTAAEKPSSSRISPSKTGNGGDRETTYDPDADFDSHTIEDFIMRSDTTLPLIQKSGDRGSSNGLKKHPPNSKNASNCRLGKGVFVGPGRCCKNCCVIL